MSSEYLAQQRSSLNGFEQIKNSKIMENNYESRISQSSRPHFGTSGKTSTSHESQGFMKSDNSNSNIFGFQEGNNGSRNIRGIKSPVNERLQFMTSCLLGRTVEVQVKSGAIYSGIFHASNVEKDFGVILKMARIVKDGFVKGGTGGLLKDTDKKVPIKTLIILANDLVQVIAKDMPICTKDLVNGRALGNKQDIVTDSFLSQSHHPSLTRELEPWTPDNDVPDELELEETFRNPSNRNWDQFEANETLFGVKSTYDEEIYTTKLERGPHTRDMEREAARIAREIEEETTENFHLAEERGLRFSRELDTLDEESKYSSVLRAGGDDTGEDGEDTYIDSYNDETFTNDLSFSGPSSSISNKAYQYAEADNCRKQHSSSSHVSGYPCKVDELAPIYEQNSSKSFEKLDNDQKRSFQGHLEVRDDTGRRIEKVTLKDSVKRDEKKDSVNELTLKKGKLHSRENLSQLQQSKISAGEKPSLSDGQLSSKPTKGVLLHTSSVSSSVSQYSKAATPPPASALPMPTSLGSFNTDQDCMKDNKETSSIVISKGIFCSKSDSSNPKAQSKASGTTPYIRPESAGALPCVSSSISVSTSGSSLTSALQKKSTLNPSAKEFKLNPNAKSFIPTFGSTRTSMGPQFSNHLTNGNIPVTHMQSLTQPVTPNSVNQSLSSTLSYGPYNSLPPGGVTGHTYLQPIASYSPPVPSAALITSFTSYSAIEASAGQQYSQHMLPGQVLYIPTYPQEMLQGPPQPRRIISSFTARRQNQHSSNDGSAS